MGDSVQKRVSLFVVVVVYMMVPDIMCGKPFRIANEHFMNTKNSVHV